VTDEGRKARVGQNHRDWIYRERKGNKIYFRFIYGFTNRRPHLSCRVSAFAKFKITAVQIFPAAQSMYVMCTVNMLTQYQIEGVL